VLNAFQYTHLGINYQCSTPCNVVTGPGANCGGEYDDYPVVSLFGRI
jgi:hypothetical protein